ncbi:hypothetical protein OESDEN_18349 [Oesophagostomum dentatum]|uniref:Uncharacterized protein n=1 Tax=Oesophagostomum dentatum TaxID=61180 RepID=A0A0B1SDI6_OESDE|nr:hypothetical protein OESDEN_18349 [Oesophagostomum dentatum]
MLYDRAAKETAFKLVNLFLCIFRPKPGHPIYLADSTDNNGCLSSLTCKTVSKTLDNPVNSTCSRKEGLCEIYGYSKDVLVNVNCGGTEWH